MPQIVVIVSSFIKCDFTGFKKGFSFDSYVTIFNRLWTNIRNTFVFSSVAIVFIIILGMLISYIVVRQKGLAGQLMDLLIMFPFVIPGAVLGISLIVAFNKQPVILTADGCQCGRSFHQSGSVPDEDIFPCDSTSDGTWYSVRRDLELDYLH